MSTISGICIDPGFLHGIILQTKEFPLTFRGCCSAEFSQLLLKKEKILISLSFLEGIFFWIKNSSRTVFPTPALFFRTFLHCFLAFIGFMISLLTSSALCFCTYRVFSMWLPEDYHWFPATGLGYALFSFHLVHFGFIE